jgi:hypothetical protein
VKLELCSPTCRDSELGHHLVATYKAHSWGTCGTIGTNQLMGINGTKNNGIIIELIIKDDYIVIIN